MKDIKSKIVSAFQTSKKLRVVGYVDSKGAVKDLELEMIGPDGYLDIVDESYHFIAALPKPDAFSAYDWTEAVTQQLMSWRKALSGVPQRDTSDAIVQHEDGAYFSRGDDEEIILRHLRNIGDIDGAKAIVHRDSITAAKAWIRQNSPVVRYVNMIILRPGKFQSVEVL